MRPITQVVPFLKSVATIRYIKRKCIHVNLALLCLLFGGVLLFTRDTSATSQEYPPAWGSKSSEAGLLRVMRYIEREGEVDGVVRDAFVDRIWRSIKMDIFQDFIYQTRIKALKQIHVGGNNGAGGDGMNIFEKNYQGDDNKKSKEELDNNVFLKELADLLKDSLLRDNIMNRDFDNIESVKDILRIGSGDDIKIENKEILFEREKIIGKGGEGRRDNLINDDKNNVVDNAETKHFISNSTRDETVENDLKSWLNSRDMISNNRRRPLDSLVSNQNLQNQPKDLNQWGVQSQGIDSEEKRKQFDYDRFLSLPVINTFDFSYKFDESNACSFSTDSTQILIAVPTAPANFERRKKVRVSSIAKFAQIPENRAKLLFFMGVPDPSSEGKSSRTIQNFIDEEQRLHKDIVQANFIDSYRNLTKKAAQLLHWSSTYCNNGKFLIRTDDDVKVNIKEVIKSMEAQKTTNEHFILGKRREGWKPVRDINSKYSKYILNYEDFPYKYLPPFLLGGALGYPIKTAGLLLEAMRRVSLTWLDDVYVTGICARKVGVPIFQNDAFDFDHDND